MTEIREDSRGLYVMVDGQRARPGNVAGDHGYSTDSGGATVGQQVRAKLLDCGKWVRLRFAGQERHWSTSSTLRGDAPTSEPRAWNYQPGQVYEQRDGGLFTVHAVMEPTSFYVTDYGYVVSNKAGSLRGPMGEWNQKSQRPSETPGDLVRLLSSEQAKRALEAQAA